jgi:hypothetical protein
MVTRWTDGAHLLQGGSRDQIFQGSDNFSLILLDLSYEGSQGHGASPDID